MASIGYYEPALFIPESLGNAPNIRRLTPGSGHTGTAVIQRGDFVVLASGTIARAATNQAANIAGLAQVNELDLFHNLTNVGPYDQQLFGFDQVNTLLPADPGQITVYPLPASSAGMMVELNLLNTTGWVSGGTTQVNLGSTVGITLDATTNLFIADVTQTNKVLTIFSKPFGPNKGGVGDTGARVVCYFNSGVV